MGQNDERECEGDVLHAEACSHFHVRGALRGRLQATFKDNIIDYRRVTRILKKLRYHGYIGIEYAWIDWEYCNETDNVSETILYRDFFRKLWPSTRTQGTCHVFHRS